ncbi:glycoside hydrolase superfamily [Mycena epipterygia]|nr:glycoside hydrolase superfamily [Mycena epipterygia]
MVPHSSRTVLFGVALLSCVVADRIVRRSPPKANGVIIQLFEWPWESVASKCTSFIGAFDYGYVQVSPAVEHITGTQWWTDYQPVSYILTSKRGDRSQFANMVLTCANAGVGVIVDVVTNHMTGGEGVGFAGSACSKYNYDLNNITDVRFCELDSLADLAQEQAGVKASIEAYFKDLVSLGVSGFRVDAAQYMELTDLKAIYTSLGGSHYFTQEVYDGSASAPSQYDSMGDVIEFGAPEYVRGAFLGTDGTVSNLVTPVPMGTPWDLIPSDVANYIMASQDTERSGTTSLNSNSPNNAYTLSAIFMLGFNYGTPTVFSGYDYTDYDAGAPQNAAGNTNPVTCFENDWRCEHRWIAIANMVLYHNAVGSAALTNVFVGTTQQVDCDISHDTDTSPTTCSGPTYKVSSSGTFTASVLPYDALALYSDKDSFQSAF